MTNADIINCKDKTWMPEALYDWLIANYRKVKSPSEGSNWQVAREAGNDYKYGRVYIDTERMLWRGPTFDEFYGGGIVD